MKITYPYEKEINTRKEAIYYINHQCDDCPQNVSCRKCSSSQMTKCMESIKLVKDAFEKVNYDDLAKQKRIVILPVPLGSKVFEICENYSFGPDWENKKKSYHIEEKRFDLDMFYLFNETVFKTEKEAKNKIKELEKS